MTQQNKDTSPLQENQPEILWQGDNEAIVRLQSQTLEQYEAMIKERDRQHNTTALQEKAEIEYEEGITQVHLKSIESDFTEMVVHKVQDQLFIEIYFSDAYQNHTGNMQYQFTIDKDQGQKFVDFLNSQEGKNELAKIQKEIDEVNEGAKIDWDRINNPSVQSSLNSQLAEKEEKIKSLESQIREMESFIQIIRGE